MINGILRHKKLVLIVFGLLIVFSLLLLPSVKVNYNLLDYLPEDSSSTIAVNKIEEVFGDIQEGGTRVACPVGSFPEALEIKRQIAALDGIESVRWLDDTADINQPESFVDEEVLSGWYKDGYALFKIQFGDDATGKSTAETLTQLRTLIGPDGALAGGAVNNAAAKQNTGAELKTMMMLLLPLMLIIMLIATTSWFEPLLFLLVIGLAVVINTGTNALLGDISFVTQTAAAVLQLAVSMDYSIFLIHRFRDYRAAGLEAQAAMRAAMKSAFPSIIASGLTTIFGFAALMLMRFQIGADMGVVLAKGVMFSLLSVVFLLPVLTMLTYRLIEKTSHRPFLPRFTRLGKFALRAAVPIVVLIALSVVPAFLAQQKNDFIYGESAVIGDPSSQLGRDDSLIGEHFGASNQLVLMVPDGDLLTEKTLAESLMALPAVTDISSYVTDIGPLIPPESVPESTLSKMITGGYSRMVIDLDAPTESDAAFAAVAEIRDIASHHYDEYYLAGASANIYDMKEVVTADNKVVNIAAVAAIALVILLTFRSLSIPVLLVLTIEASIWLNLAVPYFSGDAIVYIGYIIISSIQLGATVDYAILYSGRYLEKRSLLDRRAAAAAALSETFGSILTSASILISAGLIIGFISTNGVISQLGELISRGAALSTFTVVFLLPGLMAMFDGVIKKTTMKTDFLEVTK